MNAGIRAMVRTGNYHGLEVLGVQRGYTGMMDGSIFAIGAHSVSGIINRRGTVLHTARCKPFMETKGRTQAVK